MRSLRLGTRASPLAQWQANWVAAQLLQHGIQVKLVPITTSGDQQLVPIAASGDRGLFTKEVQRELLGGRIDLAVHSLKDLPTDAVPGLALAAVPPRGPVADVLVSVHHRSLAELPQGSVVGTGSLRRRAQILYARPDLVMKDIRGNVDTRLRKLAEGQYTAIVLAEAGLSRLGLADQITEVLPHTLMLPAIGQGALGIETRDDDTTTRQSLAPLDDLPTHQSVLAERAMLDALQGGCLAPIAAWAQVVDGNLELAGRVLSPDGRRRLEVSVSGSPQGAESLGRQAAQALLDQGAAELIAALR